MRAKSELKIREDRALALGPHLKNWEGAQVLLAVIRKGSLRRAAEAMSLPVMAARRRIEQLESEVGARLFVRDRRGTRLTTDGESVFAAIERMEAASIDLLRTQNSLMQSISGPIRIRAPESLGSFWLPSRLGEFQRAFPKILIDLDCSPGADNALQENDVALTLAKPVAGAKHVKLGRVHFALFAGPRYVETFGAPLSVDELANHRWVSHTDQPGGLNDVMKHWFSSADAENLPVMKNSSSTSHYWAVAQGIGLGALPTYLTILGSNLRPVEIGLKHAADVWLSCHPESHRFARVGRMIDWLVEAFDPSKFPWFRDEFVPPEQLAEHYKGAPLAQLFDTCSSGGR